LKNSPKLFIIYLSRGFTKVANTITIYIEINKTTVEKTNKNNHNNEKVLTIEIYLYQTHPDLLRNQSR
jgi:hypothetical protein